MSFLVWALIPLAGMLLTGFREWLKFKSKQERLGASTHELEETVSTLRASLEDAETERRRLTERVQNLEAIVTTQTWDALHADPARAALEEGNGHRAPEAEATPSDAEKAERLARLIER